MNENSAVRTLHDLKIAFDRHGVEFWLDSGTLLGAIRDGKFIPWDNDIDLGAWESSLPTIADACVDLRNSGFYTKFHKNYIEIRRDDCLINLSLFSCKGNMAIKPWGPRAYRVNRYIVSLYEKMAWGILNPNFGRVSLATVFSIKNALQIIFAKTALFLPEVVRNIVILQFDKFVEQSRWEIPKEYFLHLKFHEFYHLEFKIPSKVDDYLTLRYGKGWRLPTKNWQTAKDDGAMVLAQRVCMPKKCEIETASKK